MKIKSIFNIMYLEDKIMINSGNNMIEISPADNDIQELVKYLEQGIEIEELYSKSAIEKEDIDEFIQKLNEMNYFESEEIIDREYTKRNQTNLNFLKNYSTKYNSAINIQKKIENKKVLLLGVGGASILAASLIGMGVRIITLVDYDKVEYGNLNRQFIYTENDIGKYKVDVAQKYLLSLNKNIKVSTHNMKITNYRDILGLVDEADIVINAIDTPPVESTRWINYCCLKKGKVLFQMGLSQKSILIESFTYKSGCYDCSLLYQLKENFDEASSILRYIYDDSYHSVNTSYAPNILVGTGLLLMEIFKYILDEDHYEDCNFEFEPETCTMKNINSHIRNCTCPTCGSEGKNYFSIYDLIGVAKDEHKNR